MHHRHRQHREDHDLHPEQELQPVVGDLAVRRDLDRDQHGRGARRRDGHRHEARDPGMPAHERDTHADDGQPGRHDEPEVDVDAPTVDGQRVGRRHPGEHDGGVRKGRHHDHDDGRRQRDPRSRRHPPASTQWQDQHEEHGPCEGEEQHPGRRDADDGTADRGERQRRHHPRRGHRQQHDGDGQTAGDGEVHDAAADGQRARPEEEDGRAKRRDGGGEHRPSPDGGQRTASGHDRRRDRDDHQRHRPRVGGELGGQRRVARADEQLDEPGGDGVEALRVAGELPGGARCGRGQRVDGDAEPPDHVDHAEVGDVVPAAQQHAHGLGRGLRREPGAGAGDADPDGQREREVGRPQPGPQPSQAGAGVLGGPDPRGQRAREHGHAERHPARLAHLQRPPPEDLAPPEQEAAREQDAPGQLPRRRHEQHQQGRDDHAHGAVEHPGQAPEQHRVGGERRAHEPADDATGHRRDVDGGRRERRRRSRARSDLDGR